MFRGEISQIECNRFFGQSAIQYGKYCFEHLVILAQDVVTPKSQNRVSGSVHVLITSCIVRTVRMLASIQFDNQLALSAQEVSEVRANRKLANEFVPA